MNTYQITFITKEVPTEFHSVEDPRPEGVGKKDSVQTIIESLGGKIINEESLGRKKFAYPIKKATAGFYYNFTIDLDKKNLVDLDKKLRLDENVLRFLMVAKETAKKPIKEKPKPIAVKPEKETVIRIQKTEVKPVKIELAKPTIKQKTVSQPQIEPESRKPIITPFVKPKEEAVSEEERLKKLEEKLDELLKE